MEKTTTLYAQLKECKNIKELYQVLGEERLEKVAYWLLCAWVLLPMFSMASHIFWAIKMESVQFRLAFLWTDYWAAVKYMGIFSLIYVLIYVIGKIVLKSATQLKKTNLILEWFKNLKSIPWNMALLCMLLWACFCTIFSKDLKTSIWGNDYHYEGIVTYFYYAAVFVMAQITKKKQYRIFLMRLFSIVATMVCIIVVLQDFDLFGLTQVFNEPMAAVFFHFNHLGYYLSISLLCVAGLWVLDDSPWWRVFYFISLYIHFWGILVNSTLGSYLGICVGIIAVTILIRNWSKEKTNQKQITQNLLWLWVLFLGTMFMSYLDWIPSSSGENMRTNLERMYYDFYNIFFDSDAAVYGGYDGAGHGRLLYWITGVKMLLKSPIIGYGPEMYHEVLIEDIAIQRVDLEILQYGVFFGFPGMLLYLYSLFSLAGYRIKHLVKQSPETLIAAGCIISYMGSSCFGNTMFYTVPYFWMVLGMVASETLYTKLT